MAWRAGAEHALMEKSGLLRLRTGYKHKWYAGIDAGFENLAQIDDNGKTLLRTGDIREAVLKGKLVLPFWSDFS